MHASSLENMQKCYENFVKKWPWDFTRKISVVDIGGVNVNGTYADIFSGSEFFYQSADINPEENVDILLEDPYKLPFEDNSVDILISGQAFEHVEFFWLLFSEMVRVISESGLIILIAPSSGPIHRYPVDCYRFYPDAYKALASYTDCNLLQLYHDERGPWKDLVGVFSKQSGEFTKSLKTKSDSFSWQLNRYEAETFPARLYEQTEDERRQENLIKGKENYLVTLSKLHESIVPNFYLEIGVREGRSLCLANCEALGIDPQYDIKVALKSNHQIFSTTSDRFFESEDISRLDTADIDLAFIDGMHLFEFALRDFINIEKKSSSHTIVVVDDIFPNHVIQSSRQRKSRVWTGDVWKLAECLSKFRPDLELIYLDTLPTGLLIIVGLNSNNKVLLESYNPIVREYKNMELEGELEAKIVERKLAISPSKSELWECLSQFSKDLRRANHSAKITLLNEFKRKIRKVKTL